MLHNDHIIQETRVATVAKEALFPHTTSIFEITVYMSCQRCVVLTSKYR